MFENKKILILGMARSGYEAAKLLIKRNNTVFINDLKKEQDINHIKELEELGVKVILGEHPGDLLTSEFDYLIKNPGIRNDHKYVKLANDLNIPVINEVEMAYTLMPKDISLIGITGSNGKTTTTSIIYEIIKSSGKRVHLTGNIGFPLSSFVEKIKEKDIVIMEISVQQLFNVKKFKTDISVLTNLYPVHLDFVGNYDNYINIKKRVFNYHTKKDYAVLNFDNNDVMKIKNDIMSDKVYFSSVKENVNGCYIKDNRIYYFDQKIINISELKLKGKHNYENIMCAILVAKKLDVDTDTIRKVLKEFKGVEHRNEYVGKINGRIFYNDSKSTNVVSTQTALTAFDENVILLLGGLDRGHSFDELTEYMNNVKLVISYGETKTRIKSLCDKLGIKCIVADELINATNEAYNNSEENDIILLSPACASWDQFKDFEERGNKFKEYINKL